MGEIDILMHGPGHWFKSGYGKNMHYIIKYLKDDFNLAILSNQINTDFNFPLEVDGIKIYGSTQGFYNVEILQQVIKVVKPKVLFSLWDVWIYIDVHTREKKIKKELVNWVPYCPIDAPLWDKCPITLALTEASHIIAFSKFGYNEITKFFDKSKVTLIPHGVDTDIHKPRSKEEALEIISKEIPILKDTLRNKIVFLFVGEATTERKDEARLLKAFRLFLDRVENKDKYILILKLARPHVMGLNYDYISLVEKYKLTNNVVLIFERISEELLAALYDICDFYISASRGEGFGLPIVETMAHGKPIIVPDNSAQTEHVLDSNGGWLVKCENSSEVIWTGTSQDYPIVNVEDMTNKILLAVESLKTDEYEKKSKNALEYAKKHDWKIIGPKFNEFFKKYLNKI